jgi:uncharacterized coiled-coil protein SlyX
MNDDNSRLAVLEQSMREINDTLKELTKDVKALNQSVMRNEQQYQSHKDVVTRNERTIEALEKNVNTHQLEIAGMKGGLAVIKILMGFFGTVLIGVVGWLFTVVLNTQSNVHLHQSKIPEIEVRLTQLEKGNRP